jgi:glutamyl-tRNA reductase
MAVAIGSAGDVDIVVANRTWETAKAFAARFEGRAARLSDLPAELARTDVLLTSTGATNIMLEHADLTTAMARRNGLPLLIVDIAMPRDVDPSAGDIDGVTLLDMDDLRRFVDAGVAERYREGAKARALIEDELARYRTLTTAREAAPLVTSFRDRAESIRRGELERMDGRLAGLDDRQRAAVEALTKGIVAKLIHDPTVRLKDASGTAKGDRLAEALRDLFDL